jgi:hypothetical protein
MAKSSVLSHPTNDYFSRCFTWQVAMCEGNVCAAHILNYMEYSSNTFLDTFDKTDSVYKKKDKYLKGQPDKRNIELDNNGMPIIPLSINELTRELIYQFGRNQIIDSLHYLISEGYLLPVDNTTNSTDKIIYYSLAIEPIKHFIEFWEVLTPYRKDIMKALISLKNNKKKGDTTVYFQTIHSLILNDARFNIKLSTVYYQTIEGLILNDVYNVLRLIKTAIKTFKEYENLKNFAPDPDNQTDITVNDFPKAAAVETKEDVKHAVPPPPIEMQNEMSRFLTTDDEVVQFVIKNITDEQIESLKMRYQKVLFNRDNLTEYLYQFAAILFRDNGGFKMIDKDVKKILLNFNKWGNDIITKFETNLSMANRNKPKAQQETKVNISDRSRYNVADAMDF